MYLTTTTLSSLRKLSSVVIGCFGMSYLKRFTLNLDNFP